MSQSRPFTPFDHLGHGTGQSYPLKWRYATLPEAQAVYPHADSLDDELDWAAIQGALNAARGFIRATLARGHAPAIHRTGSSFSPTVFIPPGRWIINRPLMVYPHTTVLGADWGHSQIKLSDAGWAPSAQPMTTNPQGLMWVGPTAKQSALLWLMGDEEWPVGSGQRVAGMVNTISRLGLKCPAGAAIFNAGNQNQIDISHCWINGYGAGPTGLGFISSTPTSSDQLTNLFFHHNMIEGCRAGFIAGKVEPGSIDHNQFESCANGIYVGHGSALDIKDNLLTNFIGGAPFLNGIWVGLGYPCQITGNTIRGVESKAIKVLGSEVIVSHNTIRMANGAAIQHAGYGIHITTPAHQFGGDTRILGGRNGPFIVGGNLINCDVWPAPACPPIWFEESTGQTGIERLCDGNLPRNG